MNKNFEYVSCPVCHHEEHRKLYEITYFNDHILSQIGIDQIPESTYLCQCLHCEHRYANPQLSDESLNLYYTKHNTEYYHVGVKPVNKLINQHQRIIREIERKKTGGDVLEIGCGNGFLLDLFPKSRWRVTGVEPYEPAAVFAKEHLGLNVINEYLDEATFSKNRKYDVILLFDVMEHLKDPNAMLKLIDYYLKPDGLLVMGTGDAGSLNARLCGKQWAYTTLREHLSFFSKFSMQYFLQNFAEVDIKTVSYTGSILENTITFINNQTIRRTYNLFQMIHYKFTKFKLTRFQYVRYFLTFDHMLVIARKSHIIKAK